MGIVCFSVGIRLLIEARSRSRARELLRESGRLAGSAASRDFGSTTSARTLEYALEEIEDSTKEVNEIGSAEDYYLRFHFPEYLSREKSLQAIRGKLQELRARLEREAAEKDG
jgi:hypothetical protein